MNTPSEPINLLDYGFVRLIDSMGSDVSVARSARVSYDAAWRAGEDEGSDAKLIKYLWKHKHGTPFEAVTFTFEVKAPIFIFRQWHRHRTQSYNELSARYRPLPDQYYLPTPDVIGTQSKSSKQARDLPAHQSEDSYGARLDELRELEQHCEACFKVYRGLLEKGWPRELARMALPLNTYSQMFTTMNLRNLFGFLELRDDAHAQWEIQQYAKAMKDLIKPIVPVCLEAFELGRKGEL